MCFCLNISINFQTEKNLRKSKFLSVNIVTMPLKICMNPSALQLHEKYYLKREYKSTNIQNYTNPYHTWALQYIQVYFYQIAKMAKNVKIFICVRNVCDFKSFLLQTIPNINFAYIYIYICNVKVVTKKQ